MRINIMLYDLKMYLLIYIDPFKISHDFTILKNFYNSDIYHLTF